MSLKPLRKEAMFLVVLAMVVSGAAGQGPFLGGARFVGLSLVFLLLPPLVSASFARSAD